MNKDQQNINTTNPLLTIGYELESFQEEKNRLLSVGVPLDEAIESASTIEYDFDTDFQYYLDNMNEINSIINDDSV